ncbi:hypothetical protein RRG08_019735 [Elysia crispata]|uniref:Uncharacterized protein n=1 Tax=Elysia crispata TaxID=231223 RepID=A0AAE0Y569_9GAST|nr:hypothetical protein RRG08_019735 [Elysia crispata]
MTDSTTGPSPGPLSHMLKYKRRDNYVAVHTARCFQACQGPVDETSSSPTYDYKVCRFKYSSFASVSWAS